MVSSLSSASFFYEHVLYSKTFPASSYSLTYDNKAYQFTSSPIIEWQGVKVSPQQYLLLNKKLPSSLKKEKLQGSDYEMVEGVPLAPGAYLVVKNTKLAKPPLYPDCQLLSLKRDAFPTLIEPVESDDQEKDKQIRQRYTNEQYNALLQIFKDTKPEEQKHRIRSLLVPKLEKNWEGLPLSSQTNEKLLFSKVESHYSLQLYYTPLFDINRYKFIPWREGVLVAEIKDIEIWGFINTHFRGAQKLNILRWYAREPELAGPLLRYAENYGYFDCNLFDHVLRTNHIDDEESNKERCLMNALCYYAARSDRAHGYSRALLPPVNTNTEEWFDQEVYPQLKSDASLHSTQIAAIRETLLHGEGYHYTYINPRNNEKKCWDTGLREEMRRSHDVVSYAKSNELRIQQYERENFFSQNQFHLQLSNEATLKKWNLETYGEKITRAPLPDSYSLLDALSVSGGRITCSLSQAQQTALQKRLPINFHDHEEIVLISPYHEGKAILLKNQKRLVDKVIERSRSFCCSGVSRSHTEEVICETTITYMDNLKQVSPQAPILVWNGNECHAGFHYAAPFHKKLPHFLSKDYRLHRMNQETVEQYGLQFLTNYCLQPAWVKQENASTLFAFLSQRASHAEFHTTTFPLAGSHLSKHDFPFIIVNPFLKGKLMLCEYVAKDFWFWSQEKIKITFLSDKNLMARRTPVWAWNGDLIHPFLARVAKEQVVQDYGWKGGISPLSPSYEETLNQFGLSLAPLGSFAFLKGGFLSFVSPSQVRNERHKYRTKPFTVDDIKKKKWPVARFSDPMILDDSSDDSQNSVSFCCYAPLFKMLASSYSQNQCALSSPHSTMLCEILESAVDSLDLYKNGLPYILLISPYHQGKAILCNTVDKSIRYVSALEQLQFTPLHILIWDGNTEMPGFFQGAFSTSPHSV